ncbi:hypothetical protein BD310DRAFT_180579 [Dichomitus squalens]|uniref:Uncharacterized protein n=1 Tax=Dichomitus squalens TaxID=114155 RepID=A0A4Q9PE55_9APHY|nr:hypothetical protein BD310DRAFT_180579 [Dichomitus squalens]
MSTIVSAHSPRRYSITHHHHTVNNQTEQDSTNALNRTTAHAREPGRNSSASLHNQPMLRPPLIHPSGSADLSQPASYVLPRNPSHLDPSRLVSPRLVSPRLAPSLCNRRRLSAITAVSASARTHAKRVLPIVRHHPVPQTHTLAQAARRLSHRRPFDGDLPVARPS